jgi:hypothetical protein
MGMEGSITRNRILLFVSSVAVFFIGVLVGRLWG